MEEGPVRQGLLHLQQQQTFGKKWKKVWALLYGNSICSIARLELVEGSNPPEKKKSENKKVIRLSDCVRVSEANAESSPRGTSAFLLETTDRMYLLAAESTEQAAWTGQLCELAFKMGKDPLTKDAMHMPSHKQPAAASVTMEDNSLYNMPATDLKKFEVTVRSTEASERCHLRGAYMLKAQKDALDLWHRETGKTLYSWPYKFLRRFGRDKVTFSFEAGRRCASGEGNFEFETRQGSEIFMAIESAIRVQKGNSQDDPSWGGGSQVEHSQGGGNNETYRCVGTTGLLLLDLKNDDQKSPSDKWKLSGKTSNSINDRCSSLRPAKAIMPTSQNSKCSKTLQNAKKKGVQLPESPYSEPSDVVVRAGPTGGGRIHNKTAHNQLESEYAVPFDTIAKSLANSGFGSFLQANPNPDWPDPLYNRIEEVNVMKVKAPVHQLLEEHIYDEPEGGTSHSVYDEPAEVTGEAWKLQATEPDPLGHEYPYNPILDDYSVPKNLPGGSCTVGVGRQEESIEDWLGDCEYDNVILKNLNK
ncbi:docking protein 2 isoform X2 [Lissotriton helveticus]